MQGGDRDAGGDVVVGQGMAGVRGLGGGDADQDQGDKGNAPELHRSAPSA